MLLITNLELLKLFLAVICSGALSAILIAILKPLQIIIVNFIVAYFQFRKAKKISIKKRANGTVEIDIVGHSYQEEYEIINQLSSTTLASQPTNAKLVKAGSNVKQVTP